MIALRAE